MAHINLLPWRAEAREARKKDFFKAMIAGLILAVLVFFLVVQYFNGLLSGQEDRNSFLADEIVKVDAQIKEIEALDQERENLIARMEVIESLQLSRPKVVKTFDALVRSIPEGIHLDKLTRRGHTLTLNGVAQSNARVSVLMLDLDTNTEFVRPELQITQRMAGKDDAILKFILNVGELQLNKNNGEEDGLLE